MHAGNPPDTLAHAVHRSLLVGVTISGLLLAVGLMLALAHGRTDAELAREPVSLAARLTTADGAAVLNLGLVLLMLTPIVRVAVLGVGWALRRQWHMTAIALCVGALLAVSLLLGVG